MGASNSSEASIPPPKGPVPNGKTRICVTGFTWSHHTGRARTLAAHIADKYPEKFETWFYFDSKNYRTFLADFKEKNLPAGHALQEHTTSPFVWLETAGAQVEAIGGRDKFCEWAQPSFPDDKKVAELTSNSPGLMEAFHMSGPQHTCADAPQEDLKTDTS